MNKLDTPCVEWTKSRDKQGYGVVNIGRSKSSAHRVTWALANGEIPAGLCVLHRCDNPPCVNLAHLYLGTVQDNNRDRMERGRYNSGEWNGRSVLTAENVQDIRYASVSVTNKTLARLFNVSLDAIWRARTGRTWKDLRSQQVTP